MDHHPALRLVPLQSACLKTSGCAEFGPLNTKESDALAQNVLFCCFSIYSLMHLLTRPMSSGPLDLFSAICIIGLSTGGGTGSLIVFCFTPALP